MSIMLDPRPPGIRVLTDDEAQRIEEMHKGLPKTLKHCLTCGGAGVFRWRGVDGNPAAFQCHCIDQRIMHRYFLHSGLGLLYQRYSWDDVTMVDQSVIDAILEYDAHMDAFIRTGRGLILRGESRGTGKTLVASLLFKRMLARGIDGYFTQFNELLDAHAAGWRNEEERRWFIRRVRNAGVLVIDDIGREYAGRGMELIESALDKVIRARHDDCKPTIITTNRDEEWFQKQYRGNIMSLLSGTCEVIEVTGTDYRPTHKARADEEGRLGLVRPVVVG